MPSASQPSPSTAEVANAGFSHIQNPKNSTKIGISPDFLVVIIDVNPIAWSRKGKEKQSPLDLDKALQAIIIFLNAHIAMQHENGLAIYAAGTGQAQLLFTSAPFSSKPFAAGSGSGSTSRPTNKPDANTYQHFKHVDEQVMEGIRRLCHQMAESASLSTSSSSDSDSDAIARSTTIGIVTALSLALCHLHRLSLSDPTATDSTTTVPTASTTATSTSASITVGGATTQPQSYRSRILILSVTHDASTQYIPMMNCIFAAQKKSITIDVCKLFGKDTVFLQQAAHLTGGTYFRLPPSSDDDGGIVVLQTLLATYLPSRSLSHSLILPMLDEVDFRASCFCHRSIVNIGYVCSVCLSLFCKPRDQCPTCHSKYPSNTLQRFSDQTQLMYDP